MIAENAKEMQESTYNCLPYLFNEPIYLLKKDFVDVKPLLAPGPSENKEEKDQIGLKKESDLVEEPVQKLTGSVEKVKSAPVLKYTGKNLKKVLVLFENPQDETLPKSQEVFLGKILHAVNLNFDDIALINVAGLEDALMEQINHFNAFINISFGVKNPIILFKPHTVPYKIFRESDKVFLLADDLAEIENEKEKKVSLWNSLKSLFTGS